MPPKSPAEQRAERRKQLLAALDAEDERLLAALEEEWEQPHPLPYRYDLRHKLPRGHRP